MSDISLTFPDGAKRSYPSGITGKALAESISKSLAKRTVAMVVDGRLADLADPIEKDVAVKFVSRTDPRASATLGEPPAQVRIWFDGPVEKLFLQLRVENERKQRVDKNDARLSPDDNTLMLIVK